MIYLFIEQSDVLDLPLIPVFATTCIFGVISSILTLIEIELMIILVTASLVCLGLFFLIYFAFKTMITKPHELTKYINQKAIVQIPIDHNSTGRIKILNAEDPKEFPAKAENSISKNEKVIIEKFIGAIAIVIQLPAQEEGNLNIQTQCRRCQAIIDSISEYCPFCGDNLRSISIYE